MKKANMCFLLIIVCVSKDCQGPQGEETFDFMQKMTSWDMQFFGCRFGLHF